MKDHYRTLGIPENADEQEIKLAYRKLAKQYHPDVNPGDRRAEEKFKEISEAYNILSDPILKSAYDRKRLSHSLYSGGKYYTPWDTNPEEEKDKRDPRRKNYSPEDFERARRINRNRIFAHMQRRKKLLAGMIICFVAYLCGAAAFENWMEKKRKEEAQAEVVAHQESSVIYSSNQPANDIQDLDSPYDSLFGEGVFVRFNPNQLVIYNPVSDAVVCAVENKPPYRTIRNEFIHAKKAFVMREMPNGSFYLKVYTGENWDKKKKIPTGETLGGFSTDEEFNRIDAGPFELQKPTFEHPKTNTTDTISIDPTLVKFKKISKEEFFSKGH